MPWEQLRPVVQLKVELQFDLKSKAAHTQPLPTVTLAKTPQLPYTVPKAFSPFNFLFPPFHLERNVSR